MTGKRRPRLPGERVVGDRWDRSFAERAAVLDQRGEALRRHMAAYEEERRGLLDAVSAVVAPFGLDPAMVEPPLADLLSWVVPDGGHWRWQGRTNNKGLAVMRFRRLAEERGINTEWSACRQLHMLLASGHEPPGAMHPRCDAPFVCVRLAHRCLTCAHAEPVGRSAVVTVT